MMTLDCLRRCDRSGGVVGGVGSELVGFIVYRRIR